MPFDWYDADVAPIGAAEKADRMYDKELAERAALLLRLGYERGAAAARLRANVKWDFELNGSPRHGERIDEIVDRVYRRGGVAGGGPPALEG